MYGQCLCLLCLSISGDDPNPITQPESFHQLEVWTWGGHPRRPPSLTLQRLCGQAIPSQGAGYGTGKAMELGAAPKTWDLSKETLRWFYVFGRLKKYSKFSPMRKRNRPPRAEVAFKHTTILLILAFGRGSPPMGFHFGVGEFTTQFRTY